MNACDLPLFPLSSVLMPGGLLDLRIFEARYLDLVRDCTRHDKGFGVCLILEGSEVGAPATPAAIGTLARICDFDHLADGLLGISVRGHERFHVLRTRVRDSGLIHAEVEWMTEPAPLALPAEFGLLATILERFHERAGGEHAKAARDRYDDAAWVGYRMAEALPLDMPTRQQLLQMDDPLDRLAELMHLLPRFQNA